MTLVGGKDTHKPRRDVFDELISQQRAAMAMPVAIIRLVTVWTWLVLVLLGIWKGNLAVLSTFAATSLLTLIAVWQIPAFKFHAHWAIVGLDIINVTLGLVSSNQLFMTKAVNPTLAGANAGGNAGIMLLLPMLAFLTFDRRVFSLSVVLSFAGALVVMVTGNIATAPLVMVRVLTFTMVGALGWVGLRMVDELAKRLVIFQSHKQRLGRYFSPEVAERITALEHLAPESREVTLLFVTVRNFASMLENVEGAKAVAALNEYYATLSDLVFKHRGTLDKIFGDGVLTYFGAPLEERTHADSAVSCAFEMIEAVHLLNVNRVARGEPELRIGIGIHTGPAIIGNIGTQDRREFTLIGDIVNTALKLESVTQTLDASLAISEATLRQLANALNWTPRSPIQREKFGPLKVFTPKSSAEQTDLNLTSSATG